jgi:hypothetical protein
MEPFFLVSEYVHSTNHTMFYQGLESGCFDEVTIEGDIKLLFVTASGLPTIEEFEHVTGLEILKAPPVPRDKFVAYQMLSLQPIHNHLISYSFIYEGMAWRELSPMAWRELSFHQANGFAATYS